MRRSIRFHSVVGEVSVKITSGSLPTASLVEILTEPKSESVNQNQNLIWHLDLLDRMFMAVRALSPMLVVGARFNNKTWPFILT